MKRIDLNSTSELLNHIDLNQFPLVNHYLDYDDCYMDDNWIKYSIYYDELTFDGKIEPVGDGDRRGPRPAHRAWRCAGKFENETDFQP